MATVEIALLFWQTLLKYATAKEIITAAGNKRRLTNRQCTKGLLCSPGVPAAAAACIGLDWHIICSILLIFNTN